MRSLVLIARSELRTRWVSIVLVGLLAGLTGGVVAGAGTVARRTATADARLANATNADDVRSLIVGGTPEATVAIGAQALALPQVERGRVALGGVARIDAPGIAYYSILVGPGRWGEDILSPVLSAGRLPNGDAAGEVVVNEAMTRAGFPIGLGDTFTMHLLTAQEYAAFDANTPLAGRAGEQQVTVVGIVRLPGSPQDLPPFIGTQALAAAHPDGIGVLGAALVQLHKGADLRSYADAVNNADQSVARPAALAPFPQMSVIATAAQSRATTHTTTNVLTTGLLLLAAVGLLAGTAAVVQAILRHHAAGANAQRVEQAIGLTATQRARARVLAALPAAAVGAVITAGIGAACSRVAPPGGVRTVEPHPGWAPNIALLATAVVLVPVAVLAITGLSARRVTRSMTSRPTRDSRVASRLGSLGKRPSLNFGMRMALDRRSGTNATGARGAIMTSAAAVAGLLVAATFSSSLDRVVHHPASYGYPTDMVIADAGPDVAAAFVDDARFATIITGSSADLLIDGHAAVGITQTAVVGALTWELASGRPPATDNEIVLGTRIRDELGKGVGDAVDLVDARGNHHQLRVVGVGVVPNYSGRGLGRSAALSASALPMVAAAPPYGDLALSVRPTVNLDDVVRDLSQRYEVEVAAPPREVSNLQQIDRVPFFVGLFLAVLCIVTLGHAITMTAHRRAKDLAIVRALGFRPRQSVGSVVVMALTTTLTGLVVALPFGIVGGRFVWRRVAEGSALISHVSYPWILIATIVPLGLVVAFALAAAPARHAGRDRIVHNLRPE